MKVEVESEVQVLLLCKVCPKLCLPIFSLFLLKFLNSFHFNNDNLNAWIAGTFYCKNNCTSPNFRLCSQTGLPPNLVLILVLKCEGILVLFLLKMRLRRFNLKIFSILPLLLLSEASSENIQVKPQTSSASPYTHRSKELSLRWPALNKSILNSTVLKAVVKMSTPFNFTEATLKYSKRFFADELKFEARKDVSSLDLEVSNKRIGSKLEKPDLESIRKTLKSKIHSRTSRSPLKWWGSPNEFPNSLPLPRAIWRERINGSSGSNFTNTPILPIDSTPPVRSSVSNTTSNNTFNVNQMWIADLTTVATTELNASNITFYAPSLTPKLEGNMSAQLIPHLTPESLFSDSTTNRPIPSISAVLNCRKCVIQLET